MVSAPWISASGLPDAFHIDHAVVRAVAYSDVFDYPLRDAEVHRHLHGVATTAAETAAALDRCAAPHGHLSRRDGYFMLRGRESLVETRRERAERAARVWPAAVHYGRLIAGFPFVRMVAVTGSLAWDNVLPSADIDYVIVTEPGHLWKTRWLLAVLRRVARLDGVNLCPNCMVTTHALTAWERDVYVAYELANMKPIVGHAVYRRLRRANPWTRAYLPNAVPELRPPLVSLRPGHALRDGLLNGLAAVGERVMRTRLGAVLENVEMRYRIRKIMRYRSRRVLQGKSIGEASYGPDRCMGFGGAHRRRTLAAFADRLSALGGTP
jgi:hypothetical protein